MTLVLAWLVAGPAQAQYMPPSSGVNINVGGVSPRANKMKGDARAVRDSSRSAPKATPAPKAKTTKTAPSTDNATDYPTSAPSAVHRQAAEGKTEEIKAELAANPNDNKKKDAEGLTPLHHAAVGNHLDTVQLLITSGADLNALGARGETALYLAAATADAAVMEALIAAGADPNLATLDGKTALQQAAREGNLGGVKALLKGGANVKAVDKQGRDALKLAELYRKGDQANQVIAELIKAK